SDELCRDTRKPSVDQQRAGLMTEPAVYERIGVHLAPQRRGCRVVGIDETQLRRQIDKHDAACGLEHAPRFGECDTWLANVPIDTLSTICAECRIAER